MNKLILPYADKFNALSIRERLMVFITVLVLLGFTWWNFFGVSILAKTKQLQQQNNTLQQEINNIEQTTAAIQQRIKKGVHTAKLQKFESLKKEFNKVRDFFEQQTLALIEPEEMFELMQQLIFAESKLKLTAMKRKQVTAAFETIQGEDNETQPAIYRHVLQVSFEGQYKNILRYIQKMEALEWKLIWDKITLQTADYPVIKVNIEISTLSDNKNWVGL